MTLADSIRSESRLSGHSLRTRRCDEAPAAEPLRAINARSAPPPPSCLRLGLSLAPPVLLSLLRPCNDPGTASPSFVAPG